MMRGIVLFSDEPAMGVGLCAIFAAQAAYLPPVVCSQHAEFLQAVRTHRPQVALYVLDPDADLEIVRELAASAPGCALVLMGREIAPELAYHSMELGVRALITTTAPAETLFECMRAVEKGRSWLDPSLSVELLDKRMVGLSPRQGQLVSLLVQGLKNKEIASAMGISERTVKAYLTTLFEKVGAKDRFELALFGLKNLKHLRDIRADRSLQPKGPLRQMVARRLVSRKPVA